MTRHSNESVVPTASASVTDAETRADNAPDTDPAFDDDVSRRVFVQRLTFMGGGVVLLGSACKDDNKPVQPTAAPALPESSGLPSRSRLRVSAASSRV